MLLSGSSHKNVGMVKICPFHCFLACSKCVAGYAKGTLTCCGTGGSWDGKCGPPGDTNFEHTWSDGKLACLDAVMTDVQHKRPLNLIEGDMT